MGNDPSRSLQDFILFLPSFECAVIMLGLLFDIHNYVGVGIFSEKIGQNQNVSYLTTLNIKSGLFFYLSNNYFPRLDLLFFYLTFFFFYQSVEILLIKIERLDYYSTDHSRSLKLSRG